MKIEPVTNAAAHWAFNLARIETGFERAVETQVGRIRREMDDFVSSNELALRQNPPVFAWRCSEALRERLMALWPDLLAAYTELATVASRASGNVIAANFRVTPESIQEDTQEDLSDSILDVSDELLALLVLLGRNDIQIILTYMIWNGMLLEASYRQFARYQAAIMQQTIMAELVDSVLSPVDVIVGDIGSRPPQITVRGVREAVESRLVGLNRVSRSKGPLLREMSTLVVTQVHAIASVVQDVIVRKNSGKIVGEVWSAMMEGACPVCRSLNGNYYPLRYGKSTAPEIPVHRSCRCHKIPVASKPASAESVAGECTFPAWMKQQTEDFQRAEFGLGYHDWKAGRVTIRDFRDFRTNNAIRIRLLESLNGLVAG